MAPKTQNKRPDQKEINVWSQNQQYIIKLKYNIAHVLMHSAFHTAHDSRTSANWVQTGKDTENVIEPGAHCEKRQSRQGERDENLEEPVLVWRLSPGVREAGGHRVPVLPLPLLWGILLGGRHRAAHRH